MRSYLWDCLALVGVAAVLLGLWWIHPSVALIVGGLVVVVVAGWGAKQCRS